MLRDAVGRSIAIHNYRRIISLVPSQTEYLIYLTSDDPTISIVGRTKFCVHPSDYVVDIEIVGGTKQIHLDRIKMLQPDLIIANKEENTPDIVNSCLDIAPVFTTEVKDVDDALDTMHTLGKLIKKESKAYELCQCIESLRNQYSIKRTYRVAYLIWQNPYMTIGGDTFINDMLYQAGFTNVFHMLRRYPKVSIEDILSASPDFVFLSSEPFPFSTKHLVVFESAGLDAVLVDGEMFSWYGNRMLLSWSYFEDLHKRLKKWIS